VQNAPAAKARPKEPKARQGYSKKTQKKRLKLSIRTTISLATR